MSVERSGDAPARIATITDARGITYLTNTYCSGSCPLDPAVVTQTLADGGVSQIEYVITNRNIMQTTVTDPRGNRTAYRFNTLGHHVSTVSRPRVRDGEAQRLEKVFRRLSERNGHHEGFCESREA